MVPEASDKPQGGKRQATSVKRQARKRDNTIYNVIDLVSVLHSFTPSWCFYFPLLCQCLCLVPCRLELVAWSLSLAACRLELDACRLSLAACRLCLNLRF